MKLLKSSFLELANQLNKEEIHTFSKYLKKTDRHNSSLFKLFRLIIQCKKIPTNELKPKIFNKLYPEKPFKDVTIRLLLSELMDHFKDFLLTQSYNNNSIKREIHYLKFLRSRQLDRLFDNQINVLNKNLDSNKAWSEDKYQLHFELEKEKFRFENSKNRFNHTSLPLMMNQFELSTLLQKLKIYLEFLSISRFTNIPFSESDLEKEILPHLNSDWSTKPEIQIYILAVKLHLSFEEDIYYNTYTHLLEKYSPQMDLQTSKELHSYALNYCIRKINLNIEPYFNETLNFYNLGVTNSWILENGKMNPVTYKNIISLCIRMQDFDRAVELLEKYKSLISKKEAESIYQFNLARIHIEKGEYHKAILILNSHRFKDPLIELHARVEMIKIFFITREENLLKNQIHASQLLIKRSQQFGYHKDYYFNFLKYILLAYQKKDGKSAQKIILIDKIKSESNLVERSWLVSVLE